MRLASAFGQVTGHRLGKTALCFGKTLLTHRFIVMTRCA